MTACLDDRYLKRRTHNTFKKVPAPASGVFFAQTGHTLGDPFLSFSSLITKLKDVLSLSVTNKGLYLLHGANYDNTVSK